MPDYKVIGALGDSITNGYWDMTGKGWFGRLAEKISADFPYAYGFHNMAVDGDQTKDVLHRLNAEALNRQIDILLVAVGVNDLIRWEDPRAPTDITPQGREMVWRRLLKSIKVNYSQAVIISVLPLLEEPEYGEQNLKMYGFNDDIKEYNRFIKKWCDEFQIEFFDVFSVWSKLKYASLLYDPSHPNAEGHELLASQVYEKLKTLGWLSNEQTLIKAG